MITLDQAMTSNNFEHCTLKNLDKTPVRCRRNGKTQTWKRQPERFKIPVKHGLYDFFYITNDNANQWNIHN